MMSRLRHTVCCLCLTLFLGTASWLHAQEGIFNLRDFDSRLMHYGIQVGYSQSKFDFNFIDNDEIRQKMLGVRSYYTAGFHISIIADLRLGGYFNLRTLPGILLLTRNLNYLWQPDYAAQTPLLDHSRAVESVYGDIPIEIKFRAWRYGNFRPYVTGGGSYAFDFSSLRKNKNNNQESIIRLQANNFSYSMGVGADFFMRYVKFAIDLKFSFGTIDLLIPDDELYTRSIEKLKTRTVLLSFTFEG